MKQTLMFTVGNWLYDVRVLEGYCKKFKVKQGVERNSWHVHSTKHYPVRVPQRVHPLLMSNINIHYRC